MGADLTAAVLLYHRVHESELDPWGLCVTPTHFAAHLALLADRFSPISLRNLVAGLQSGSLPPRPVAITFDDGYADFLHTAVPLLERERIPATVFLVSGMIGGQDTFWWDELESIFLGRGRLPQRLALSISGTTHLWDLGESAGLEPAELPSPRGWRAWDGKPPSTRHAIFHEVWKLLRGATAEARKHALTELHAWADQLGATRDLVDESDARRTLTETEIRLLAGNEAIEIGAHSRTHCALAALAPDQQRDEIEGSKRDLEAVCGRPVTSFSYPFGGRDDFSDETVRLVRQASFEYACANDEGLVNAGSDPYKLHRFNIIDCDGPRFADHLQSAFTSR